MTNLKTLALACTLFLALGGCAADVAGTPDVAVSQAGLTLAECADARDACFATRGLFGILTCNAEYTLCAATADSGLPSAVTSAAAAAADCVTDLDDCVLAAQTPSELAQCAEDQAICVADIVNVDLPTIVGDTSACVDDGLDCIQSAQSVSNLAACGDDLATCATDAATAAAQAAAAAAQNIASQIVPEVTAAVDGALMCTDDATACITAATTPTALTACAQAQTECVADVLGVDLPSLPATDVVECAEDAAECTLDAQSLSDLGACADDLVSCADDLASGVVDCNAQYTQCLFQNPLFGLFTCAAQLRSCLG